MCRCSSDIARVQAEDDRLVGEMRRERGNRCARRICSCDSEERDYDEIHAEQRQIAARHGAEPGGETFTVIRASNSGPLSLNPKVGSCTRDEIPAALAVLEADVEMRRAQLNEASNTLRPSRRLYAEGLIPRSELDAAETRATTLASQFAGAGNRFEAALIDHRRKHTSTATEMKVAHTDTVTERFADRKA